MTKKINPNHEHRGVLRCEWMEWMSHRKRRETKQQPSMLPGPAVPGCCLVSFRFQCNIHSIHSVINSLKVEKATLKHFKVQIRIYVEEVENIVARARVLPRGRAIHRRGRLTDFCRCSTGKPLLSWSEARAVETAPFVTFLPFLRSRILADRGAYSNARE